MMMSDSLAKQLEACKAELGLTGELTEAQHLELARYTLTKYPECLDMANPADRMFQKVARRLTSPR